MSTQNKGISIGLLIFLFGSYGLASYTNSGWLGDDYSVSPLGLIVSLSYVGMWLAFLIIMPVFHRKVWLALSALFWIVAFLSALAMAGMMFIEAIQNIDLITTIARITLTPLGGLNVFGEDVIGKNMILYAFQALLSIAFFLISLIHKSYVTSWIYLFRPPKLKRKERKAEGERMEAYWNEYREMKAKQLSEGVDEGDDVLDELWDMPVESGIEADEEANAAEPAESIGSEPLDEPVETDGDKKASGGDGYEPVVASRSRKRRKAARKDSEAPDKDGPEKPAAEEPETPDKDGQEKPAEEEPEAPDKDGQEKPAAEESEAPDKDGQEKPAEEESEAPDKAGQEKPAPRKRSTRPRKPAADADDEPVEAEPEPDSDNKSKPDTDDKSSEPAVRKRRAKPRKPDVAAVQEPTEDESQKSVEAVDEPEPDKAPASKRKTSSRRSSGSTTKKTSATTDSATGPDEPSDGHGRKGTK